MMWPSNPNTEAGTQSLHMYIMIKMLEFVVVAIFRLLIGVEISKTKTNNMYVLGILPWTRDPALSIQVIASRGILDDIPPPIYHPITETKTWNFQPRLLWFARHRVQ